MTSPESLHQDTHLRGQYEAHRFGILIFLVVVIAVVLVLVAMSIYNSSGAAQLDMSGPRYEGVRGKVIQEKTVTSFPSSGQLDKDAFSEFSKAYDQHAKAISQVNGYAPEAVANDAFNLTPAQNSPVPPAQ